MDRDYARWVLSAGREDYLPWRLVEEAQRTLGEEPVRTGYKLMRRMNDGYAPLFINRRHRYQRITWYEAQDTGKKSGYAYRPLFHVCLQPWAPHIADKPERVWVLVEYADAIPLVRPESQGGEWVLARWIRIIREV